MQTIINHSNPCRSKVHSPILRIKYSLQNITAQYRQDTKQINLSNIKQVDPQNQHLFVDSQLFLDDNKHNHNQNAPNCSNKQGPMQRSMTGIMNWQVRGSCGRCQNSNKKENNNMMNILNSQNHELNSNTNCEDAQSKNGNSLCPQIIRIRNNKSSINYSSNKSTKNECVSKDEPKEPVLQQIMNSNVSRPIKMRNNLQVKLQMGKLKSEQNNNVKISIKINKSNLQKVNNMLKFDPSSDTVSNQNIHPEIIHSYSNPDIISSIAMTQQKVKVNRKTQENERKGSESKENRQQSHKQNIENHTNMKSQRSHQHEQHLHKLCQANNTTLKQLLHKKSVKTILGANQIQNQYQFSSPERNGPNNNKYHSGFALNMPTSPQLQKQIRQNQQLSQQLQRLQKVLVLKQSQHNQLQQNYIRMLEISNQKSQCQIKILMEESSQKMNRSKIKSKQRSISMSNSVLKQRPKQRQKQIEKNQEKHKLKNSTLSQKMSSLKSKLQRMDFSTIRTSRDVSIHKIRDKQKQDDSLVPKAQEQKDDDENEQKSDIKLSEMMV